MAERIEGVPFTAAVEALQRKLRLPTQRYDALHGRVHAKAFAIAGAMRAALLADLHEAIVTARAEGQGITQFRRAFDEIVQRHGWEYRGTRGWRTRVIYDTNLRTASMAGHWQGFVEHQAERPYLEYLTVGDGRVRPQHRAWDGTVLPIGDPWWDTHYPPNGWGCRCSVRSRSAAQLQRDGRQVSARPPVELTERINTQTGEIYGEVPVGIDTGWDYNVGKAWLGPDVALADAIQRLPPATRRVALAESATLSGLHQTAPFNAWLPLAAGGEIQTAGWLPPAAVELEASAAGRPLVTVRGERVPDLTADALRDLPARLTGDVRLAVDGADLILIPTSGLALRLRADADGVWTIVATLTRDAARAFKAVSDTR